MTQKQGQVQKKKSQHDDYLDVVDDADARAKDVKPLKGDLDEVLNEIDKVLEENAESFVKAYVQKSGQ